MNKRNIKEINKYRKSFTFIELIIVTAIITALVVVIIVALNPKARFIDAADARRLKDIDSITKALGLYLLENESLPALISDDPQMLGIASGGCEKTCHTANGNSFETTDACIDISSELEPYLKGIPIDPIGGNEERTLYAVAKDGESFFVGNCNFGNMIFSPWAVWRDVSEIATYNMGGWTQYVEAYSDYVIVSAGGSGLQLFARNEDGTLDFSNSIDVGGSTRRFVRSGDIVYAANSNGNVDIYDISSGNLVHLDSISHSSMVRSVMVKDGVLVVGLKYGINTYQINVDNSLSLLDEYTSDGMSYDIYDGGEYFVIADGWRGIKVGRYDESGNVEIVNSVTGLNTRAVDSNNGYYFVGGLGTEDNLRSYTMTPEGEMVLVDQYSLPEDVSDVKIDGNFLFAAAGSSGTYAYTINEDGSLSLNQILTTSNNNLGVSTYNGVIYLSNRNDGMVVYN